MVYIWPHFNFQVTNIFRLPRMHEIQTTVTDVRDRGVCPPVCLSVCHAAQLSVVHMCSLCKLLCPCFLFIVNIVRQMNDNTKTKPACA